MVSRRRTSVIKRELWEGPFCTCSDLGATVIKPVSAVGSISSRPRELSRAVVERIYIAVLVNIMDKSGNPYAICCRRIHARSTQSALYLIRLSEKEFSGPFCRSCLIRNVKENTHAGVGEIYMVSTTPRALKSLLDFNKTLETRKLGGVEIDPCVQLF